MKTRNFLKWATMLSVAVTLVGAVDQGRAFAKSASVPTCNGWADAAQTIPQYLAPGATTGTTVCTDFFGKANYANSPLPTGPIDISPAGILITDGGSGYTAPQLSVTDFFNSPTVVPAKCSATLDIDGSATGFVGSITGITCSSGGSGYMAPVLNITDPSGSGADVSLQLSPIGPFVGGLPKFVDALPDLKGAIAAADTTSFPGSDYYEIALVQTKATMHRDLPPTTVRGYVQLPSGSNACPTSPAYNYLGPVILAQRDRPVRVKFTNCLPTGAGGDLFIPADSTYMGAGTGPDGSQYLENRGTIHLHGGVTPWISDGTPHQWTVPVGESSTLQRGASTQMVPDMYFKNGQVVPQCSATVSAGCSGGLPAQLPQGAVNDPGQGSMSFYFTNQQSSRLMFYHDHALGLTRLNVYAGEAAGYLIYDPAEESALLNLGVPGTIATNATTQLVPDTAHLIPLVLQDKTFVPSQTQLAVQDPTWIWGTGSAPSANNGNGDLWFPHVYNPNQNPFDEGGASAFGRWDYGAWFYPAQTTLTAAGNGPLGANTAVTIPCTSAAFPGQVITPTSANNYLAGCPIIPNPSGTPEGFMDTPVVNGKAYPVLHVAPEAYRFQILDAANDRSWNLQLYKADATGTEVPMLQAIQSLPLCSKITPITNTGLGVGLTAAILDTSGNPLNGTGLLPNCWPQYGKATSLQSKQLMWPADGREGGVPDPRAAGPAIIQIGTEGGLLPAPVVIPSTPVNYEVNVKSITVTDVSTHGLWIGPAERAEVIIDFSKFAGKTLILYNDAPTPAPAYDMRDDYYTGNQDQTTTGGAPSTVPGYGPNTRTVMQIKVDLGTTGQPPFNVAKLINGIPGAQPPVPGLAGIFKTTQPEIIVPQTTYSAASGGNAPTNTYAKVQDSTITYQPAGLPVVSVTVNAGGSGYSAPAVSFAAPVCNAGASCAPATGTATVAGGVITAITVTNVGAGYTSAPAVTISDSTGTGAAASANVVTQVAFDGKAIQELFTLDYGRMNATLGNELPFTNFLVQTTLPFGYAEWPTEIVQADKPQIWFLTHNGVDTHFIHFHLFNVQVINRVGWDGSLRPPEENELGWKDTVRMNQLENIIFAIKPITPQVPFPLPDSIRPMDPTMPVGLVDPLMSGIDPATGNAITAAGGTVNSVVNFGHEYVWHCHILGHEENDMMRAMIYQVPPAMPTNLLASGPSATNHGVTLSWRDNSASETEFTVQRDTVPGFNSPALTTLTANGTSANTTGFSTLGYGQTVTLLDPNVTIGTTYYYRLLATDDFAQKSPLAAQIAAPQPGPQPASFQTVAVSSPYSSAATVTPARIAPTVSFTGAPASAPNATSFSVVASTNSSSIPVITGTAGICTVTGVTGNASGTSATVNMIASSGTCTLTASWAQDALFNSATATQSTQATLRAPTVSFSGAPASSANGTNFTVTASTNAAIKPTITGTAGICFVGAVAGTSPATAQVTMTSASGICTVTATWGATATFQAATLTQTTSTPVSITTASPLPGALTGTAYSQTLAAVGATAPYSWAISGGTLPAGLTLDPVTGVISGTPGAAGTSNFTVSVTASGGLSATKAFSLAVTTPVSITTASLPGAITGVAYSQTLSAAGGSTPLTWSVVSGGTLPNGLNLSSAGVISGNPSATGTFTFTARVAAGNGTSATQLLSITVTAPVGITTTTLPGATTGVAYNQSLGSTGGSTPLTWSVSAGALPGGLTLSSAGVISGNPGATGTFTFTARVAAGNGTSATRQLSITVTAPVSITTATLPGASTGAGYSVTLAATGATVPYTWALSTGALPTSLTLSTAGVISGTPSVTGTFNFTVQVTAANGSSATRALSIVVGSPAPAAPSGLNAAAAGATRITLTWTDNSSNETSFAIWRSADGGAPAATTLTRTAAQRTSVGGTVTYNDNTVVTGHSYAYFVTAVNAAGASAPTATATVAF
jgi:FtsP/CotA-like multicopper oxidase with cupredoxin domain